MGFKEQQAAIQRELDRFIDLLGILLPRYSKLLKRKNLTEDELHELGELEQFLKLNKYLNRMFTDTHWTCTTN